MKYSFPFNIFSKNIHFFFTIKICRGQLSTQKRFILYNTNHILFDFVTDSLQYHGRNQKLHLITITAHFRISIFFSLSQNCTYSSFKSKQTTNVYFFLFTNNFFFSQTLPRTQNFERDLWLYWAWQQVTRWHASRSTIWAWRPFPLNFKRNKVSNKNVIDLNYLNL